MKNWDDLRFFLAVAEGGSITAGANALGVDQSTVSRRIHAYEARLGRDLFYNSKKRDQLTQFGQTCLRSAYVVRDEMIRMEQSLRMDDDSLKGTIRVFTEGVLSNRLLLTSISSFLEIYPDLNVRLSTENDNPPKFQADIGIFSTNAPDPDYVGKRLATATFASYASPDYLARFQGREEDMSWLNWDDGSDAPTWPKLAPHIPDENCRMRSTSVASLIEAAKLGLGATILPCFIGEPDTALARVSPGNIVSSRDVWVFVQPEVRKVRKVRAFLDHLYAKISADRLLIETDLPTS